MTALRALAVAAVVWVLCGSAGTLAGILASLPFHGAVRFVVWAAVGTTVAAVCGYLLDHHTSKEQQ